MNDQLIQGPDLTSSLIGDLTQDLQEYQVNVRLFGAVSSLSCSNFCLKKAAAEDSTKEVEVESSDVSKKYFYVDDCLRSEKTENLAIERIKGVRIKGMST